MDGKYDRILLNLKILTQVPRNGRIRKTTRGNVTLEDEGYLVPFRRYFMSDSRHQAIGDISALLADAFAEVKLLLNSKFLLSNLEHSEQEEDERKATLERVETMYKELSGAREGIENLKSTYAEDVKTISALNLLNDKIDSQLREIRRKCTNLDLVCEEKLI